MVEIEKHNQSTGAANELGLHIADHVGAMLAYWDKNQVCKFANTAYSDWFGMARGEMVDRVTFRELLGQFYEKNLPFIKSVLKGTPQSFEHEIQTPAGEVRYSIFHCSPDIVKGKVKGFFVHVTDTSSIKKLEQELKASEAKFRRLLESVPDANIIVNNRGLIQIANAQCKKLFGYEENELINRPIEILIPKRFNKSHQNQRSAFFAKPVSRPMGEELELFGLHKSGKEFPVEISISPIELNDGLYVSAAIRDVSRRKESEEKLREVSNRLMIATQTSVIGIWDFDVANNVLLWNDIMFRLYGIKEENFSNAYEEWRNCLHPDDIGWVEREVDLALHGEKEFDTEFRVIWPDHSIHYIKARALVQRDDKGKAIRMIGTNWDITVQKLAQFEILKSNERNRIFVQQSPNAIAMFDTEMCYMAASQRWIEDYNLSGIEIIGRSHYEIFPEIGDDWKAIHQECLKGAINKRDEASFERADGSIQWITWDVRPWYISEGNIGGLLMYTADITHLKEKDQEKRRTEEILDKTNEVARIGTWEINIKSGRITMSRVTREIHEIPADFEPDLATITNFYKEGESRDKIQKAFSEAREHGTYFDLEVELTTPKGNTVWVRVIGQAEFVKGKCRRLYGALQDINEKKKQTVLLQLSEERWKFALEGSGDGIWDWNAETNEVFFSDQWKEMLGYESHEIGTSLKEWSKRVHPDDIENCYADLNKHFSGETAIYSNEHRVLCKDGTYKWILDRGKVISRSKDGKPLRVIGTHTDLTAHINIEKELKQSEEQFRQTFEYAPIGMALMDLTGKWIRVNKSLCSILGYREEELLQTTFQDITHPKDINEDLVFLQELMEGKRENYQMEKRYFHKNGNIVWVLLAVSILKDKEGGPKHFVYQIEDITKRKNAEEALNKVNEELKAIFNSGAISIIGTDKEGLITHFNNGAEMLLQYSASEIIGRHTPAIIHVEQEMVERGEELSALYGRRISGFDVLVELARQGKFESREWTYVRKDGSTFPVQLMVTALTNESGQVTGFLGVATDISDRKEAEEKIRRYSILESKSKEMEQFAYITSHDLREPLLTIKNYIELLVEDYGDKMDESAQRYTQSISRASSRMNTLINGLLDYSRLSKIKQMQEVDSDEVVKEVQADLNLLITSTKSTLIVDELPVIKAYPLELKLLFQNLIDNAIKFRKKDVLPEIQISANRINNGWEFRVKDNGIGIAEKDRDKIFIIFQRLHNASEFEGTGIGLAHCKKIIELHSGKIWVDSIPEQGSTFCFTILTESL